MEVLIGLESPSAMSLKGLELNNDWKHRQREHYHKLILNIQSAGIRVNGCFIVGLDGDTEASFDALYDWVVELGLYDVQICYPTAFPGTPFYERLKAAGRLDQPDDWAMRTLFDLHFDPTPMDRETLRAGFVDLVRRIYGEECTRLRRAGYRAQRRAGRCPDAPNSSLVSRPPEA